MPGAFEVSAEPGFDDEISTATEVDRSGVEALIRLTDAAESAAPRDVDLYLVRWIHRLWFETTFPVDAGVERPLMVVNRKQTAAPVGSIIPGVEGGCGNWTYRRQYAPTDEGDLVEFLVVEANALAVTVYDVHPFIDGNTRTTWHLRNYVLALDGLRPLVDLRDQERYEEAWWKATPQDHGDLDRIVLEELDAQDR